MGRKPEDTAMAATAAAARPFTIRREVTPAGITLTAIWTGLDPGACAAIAEQVEDLVRCPEDYDPYDGDIWDGGGAGHDFN